MTLYQIQKIESTVIRLCHEISIIQRENRWNEMGEDELLFEMSSAILGSQVSFELASAAANRLRDEGILRHHIKKNTETALSKRIDEALSRPLHYPGWKVTGRRYRFPRLRARQLDVAMQNIYRANGSLKRMLSYCSSGPMARIQLVRKVLGLGPKQASLFLRNVGYSDDLAILDAHVLSYMGIRGMTNLRSSPATISTYEKVENHLLEHSLTLGFPLSCLDQAIWVTMRVARREVWQ